MSLKIESTTAVTRKVRLQRRLNALISVVVAVAILAVFSAIMESFTTPPIPEYAPQFILREERIETTCGGMGCGFSNYQPPRPKPIPVESWIIPKLERWEYEPWELEVSPISLDESPEPMEF